MWVVVSLIQQHEKLLMSVVEVMVSFASVISGLCKLTILPVITRGAPHWSKVPAVWLASALVSIYPG